MLPRHHLAAFLRVLPYRMRKHSRFKRMTNWESHEAEAADREIALRGRGLPPKGDETVLFMMCLVGRSSNRDWDKINALLADTLQSLLDQTDPNWQLLICGQDRPDVLPDDPRIIHLPFVRGPEETRDYDRGYKFDRMRAWAITQGPETGIGFLLDGDDIVHRDLVKHIRATRPAHGVLVNRGYSLASDEGHGRKLAPRDWLRGRFANDPFWRNCGSCVGVFFDRREGGVGDALLATVMHPRHVKVGHLMAILGRPLDEVPFAAVIYRILHGQNQYKPSKGGRSMPSLLPARDIAQIREDFPVLAKTLGAGQGPQD